MPDSSGKQFGPVVEGRGNFLRPSFLNAQYSKLSLFRVRRFILSLSPYPHRIFPRDQKLKPRTENR
jgi:hypothetical protein